jgi:hypothetical protein
LRAEILEQLLTVHRRHVPIRNDQGVPCGVDFSQRVGTVDGFVEIIIAQLRQNFSNHASYDPAVIDNQNFAVFIYDHFGSSQSCPIFILTNTTRRRHIGAPGFRSRRIALTGFRGSGNKCAFAVFTPIGKQNAF